MTLAATAPTWARAIAPHAEWLAQALANTRQLELPTPLTERNRSHAKNPRPAKPTRKPAVLRATCANCGAALEQPDRKNCPNCQEAEKQRQIEHFQDRATARLAELRGNGRDPTQTPSARAKRSYTQAQNAKRRAQWENKNPNPPHPSEFEPIRAQLRGVPLSRLRKATGLSLSYCARIRDGDAVPHPMHWEALDNLSRATERVAATPVARFSEPAGCRPQRQAVHRQSHSPHVPLPAK